MEQWYINTIIFIPVQFKCNCRCLNQRQLEHLATLKCVLKLAKWLCIDIIIQVLSTNNKTRHHIWEQFHSSMTTNDFNPSFKIVNEWGTKQVNHLHFKYNSLGWFICLVAFLFHFWMHLLVTKCQPGWFPTCLLKKHFLSYLVLYAKTNHQTFGKYLPVIIAFANSRQNDFFQTW